MRGDVHDVVRRPFQLIGKAGPAERLVDQRLAALDRLHGGDFARHVGQVDKSLHRLRDAEHERDARTGGERLRRDQVHARRDRGGVSFHQKIAPVVQGGERDHPQRLVGHDDQRIDAVRGQDRFDRPDQLVVKLARRTEELVRRALLQQFAKPPHLVGQHRLGHRDCELALLLAEANQQFEPVGKGDRVQHRRARRHLLDRLLPVREAGDAGIAEIILQLGFLKLLDRVARLADQPRRLARFGRGPAQQKVAELAVERAEDGPVGRLAVVVFDRDVLADRLQVGDRATIARQSDVRLALLLGQPRLLPLQPERYFGSRGLLRRQQPAFGQIRRLGRPAGAFGQAPEPALRQRGEPGVVQRLGGALGRLEGAASNRLRTRSLAAARLQRDRPGRHQRQAAAVARPGRFEPVDGASEQRRGTARIVAA